MYNYLLKTNETIFILYQRDKATITFYVPMNNEHIN